MTVPLERKHLRASANHAQRSESLLNSWIASKPNTTSADPVATGQRL
jgi:hypothetical protein